MAKNIAESFAPSLSRAHANVADDRRICDNVWLVHTADADETKLSCLIASAM